MSKGVGRTVRDLLELVTKSHMEPGTVVKRSRRIAISYTAIAPLLALADIAIIIFSSMAGGGLYQLAIGSPTSDLEALAGIGLLSSVAYGLSARYMDLYSLQSLFRGRRQYWRIITCIGFAVFLLTVILFLLKWKPIFPWFGDLLHCLGGNVVDRLARCFESASKKCACCRRDPRTPCPHSRRRTRTRGSYSGFTPDRLWDRRRAELPRHIAKDSSRGDVEAIEGAIELARGTQADEILLCVSWGEREQLELLRHQLRVVPLPVRLLPDSFVRSFWAQNHEAGGFNLVELQRAPLSRAEQLGKRLFDLFAAGVTLVMLLPLMILTAFALKLEGNGPIIFKQRRRGFNGREFEIYKFRTMNVLEDGPHIRQVEQGDSRVTAIGRILRRTSIDELPQLFNVLKGQMSIVGPRPHAVAHDEEYAALIGNYAFRHHVKPGITGWAQINGLRGGTPHLEQMQQRIEQDLWYINNWSLSLDGTILLRTFVEFLRPRNAY